jgi:pyruvate/2-oxoglutarate dehydrogenase complex dihydrolipoamide dehydrogenase (E3) component
MKVDVIVIGAGQAGPPLAARLAEAGRRVLIAEAKDLGGTCVNNGCTPTKTMIASARAAHVARTAGRLGVRTGDVRWTWPRSWTARTRSWANGGSRCRSGWTRRASA